VTEGRKVVWMVREAVAMVAVKVGEVGLVVAATAVVRVEVAREAVREVEANATAHV